MKNSAVGQIEQNDRFNSFHIGLQLCPLALLSCALVIDVSDGARNPDNP